VKQLPRYRSYTNEILSEVKILRLCDHKNVLKLEEVYEVKNIGPDFVHLVLDPWAPHTLNSLIRRVRAGYDLDYPWWNANDTFETVIKICGQLLEGLCHLHERLIMHKDLKPENILLFHDPQNPKQVVPVISDFGDGKLRDPNKSTKYTNTTAAYLSHEKIEHLASGLSADVFAMGCCFLLLYLIARDGQEGLAAADALIQDSGQYAREEEGIHNLLLARQTRSKAHNPLIWVTRHMLAKLAENRPDAKVARGVLSGEFNADDWFVR
jgi:serine/threonine protein kinase